MTEYISREKAIEVIKNYGKGAISDGMKTLDPVDDMVYLAKAIDLIPAANVSEVKHGHWKKDKNKRACSLCGFVYYQNGDDNFSFCPDCGAKMDGAPK